MLREIEQYRYEKKYVMANNSIFFIQDFIKNSQLMFYKKYENRILNTIYFDNNNFDLYNQNINGLYNRKKIRIRWYSDKLEIIKPILEVKIKKGNLGKKLKFNLTPIKNNQYAISSLLNTFYKNNLDQFTKEKIYGYKANSFISYTREYYLSRKIDCRLTFDSNIRFYNIYANKLNNSYQKYNKTILEIKFPANLDSFLLDGLSDLPVRSSRHSKYVECINMIR